MRSVAKAAAFWCASALVLPSLLSYAVRRAFVGPNRALEGSSQALSLLPGITGEYLRRAFLCRVLAHCDRSVTIQFGTIFSQAGARLDADVYVGPGCHLGLVHLKRDVLVASGVHIPSGPATHGTEDTSRPIREQPSVRSLVTVGEGSWIGSAAIVLADVGRHCVVGAGAVVTRPVPDFTVSAGVPARVLKERRPSGVAT